MTITFTSIVFVFLLVFHLTNSRCRHLIVHADEAYNFDTDEAVRTTTIDHGSNPNTHANRHTIHHQPTQTQLLHHDNYHKTDKVPYDYDGVIQVPLKFQSGSYHMTIQVGRTKNKYDTKRLIVDTGSRITTWKDCSDRMNSFDIDRSRMNSGTRTHSNNDNDITRRRNSNNNCSCFFTNDSVCIPTKKKYNKKQNSFIRDRNHNTSSSVCSLYQKYSEGSSWYGYEKTDMVSIEHSTFKEGTIGDVSLHLLQSSSPSTTSTTTFPLRYACQTTVTGLFQHQYADGILGLGPYSNNVNNAMMYSNHVTNDTILTTQGEKSSSSSSLFIDSLYQNGAIRNRCFSLCLTKTGGFIGFGGPLVQYHHHHHHVLQKSKTRATLETEQQTRLGHNIGAKNPHYTDNMALDAMKYTFLRENIRYPEEIHQKSKSISSSRRLSGNSKQTKMKKHYNVYSVWVEEVWIGTYCLTCMNEHYLNAFNSGRGTILDSGTTDTFLPNIIRDPLDTIWAQHHHRSQRSAAISNNIQKTIHYDYTIDQFQELPIITFVLRNNVTFKVHPSNYMDGDFTQLHSTASNGITSTTNNNNDALSNVSSAEVPSIQPRRRKSITSGIPFERRIYTTEPVGAVLGINSMIGYDILFDPENQRIGFVDATCG